MVITNNPESSIYTFEDPIDTNMTTKQAEILSLGMTVCSIIFEFFILGSLYKNRRHNIMKVSQVPFLMAFLVVGIFAIVCGIFLVTTNQIFCALRMLVNIPLSIM